MHPNFEKTGKVVAELAQLVEQRIRNAWVGGSSPPFGSTFVFYRQTEMSVAIVKYNAGNIFSVINAVKRLGIDPILTDDADKLRRADKVIFPGQGEANTTMSYQIGRAHV